MLLDKEHALNMQNGDKEFLMEIWQIYVDDAKGKREKFEEALNEKDYIALEKLAHSMKSSSAVIGSNPLSKLAANLEAAARSKDKGNVEDSYNKFMEALSEVLVLLEEELKEQK